MPQKKQTKQVQRFSTITLPNGEKKGSPPVARMSAKLYKN